MLSQYLLMRIPVPLLKFTYQHIMDCNYTCSSNTLSGITFSDPEDTQLYKDYVNACKAFKLSNALLRKPTPKFNQVSFYYIPSFVPSNVRIIIDSSVWSEVC